ncbi:MAG: type IV pilus biogenesis/stability protein PilW [Azovibrio sp.]|uniref:type IV pilus biogenesis/stability protein PilW n=1 Tax=Azovibrio sp. TaxID=1872673 RepID=UPI003C71E51A
MIRSLVMLLAWALSLGSLPVAAQVVVPESTHTNLVTTDARTRARLHTELGAMYFQDGNLAVALEEVGIAIESDSSYASAYSVRGLVNAALREFPAAEADFKKALSLAPGDPDISNNYGWFLCQQGARPKESIPYFLSAIKNPLYSTPDRAFANAGACALKAGDFAAARDYLTQALRLAPDGGLMAQLQLAKLAYAEGNFVEARNRFAEVMRVSGQPTAEALWLGARIHRKLGNKVEEESMVAQLRRLYPTSPEFQEFLKGNDE